MIIFGLYQDFFSTNWYNPEIILGINSFTNNPTLSCQDTRNNHGIHQDFWNNFKIIMGIYLVSGGVQRTYYRQFRIESPLSSL